MSTHPSHETRISMDSSLYDEVCVNCGRTDGLGSIGRENQLKHPCAYPKKTSETKPVSDWLKKIRIGIVGNGVVGQATARSYLEHVAEVRCWDINPLRSVSRMSYALECDIVFVCLPTLQKKDSLECDTSIIDEFLGSIRVNGGSDNTNLVIRSTVPIGYTRKAAQTHALANLVHSPEFLTARCATVDAQMPTRNIIGGRKVWTGPTDEDDLEVDMRQGVVQLTKLYQERWPHVQIMLMSSDESEFVKLTQNSFFAIKIAAWNEFHCLAGKLGLDWDTVRNAILADGRIHPSHTQVPGQDEKFGFGGSCLPKDLASLVYHIGKSGMNFTPNLSVALSALNRNFDDRKRGESK